MLGRCSGRPKPVAWIVRISAACAGSAVETSLPSPCVTAGPLPVAMTSGREAGMRRSRMRRFPLPFARWFSWPARVPRSFGPHNQV